MSPIEKAASGIMVALYLPQHVSQQIVMEGGEPVEDLHVTLTYLPGIGHDKEAIQKIAEAILGVAEEFAAVEGRIGGIGRFNASENSDGKDVYYASFNSPVLPVVQKMVVDAIESNAGLEVSRSHGFTPHVTLKYIGTQDPTPPERKASESFKVSKISVASKMYRMDIPFSGSRVLKYDPDQPRDDAGRFGSGGGGADGGEGGESSDSVPDSQTAVREYQSGSYSSEHGGYTAIQSVLRGNNSPYVKTEADKKKVMQVADKLSETIRSEKLPEAKTLYRGVKDTGFMGDLKAGDTFSEKGFLSTTSDRKVAGKFAEKLNRGDKPTIMELKLSAGDSALNMGKFDKKNAEREFVLDRGSKFKVDSIKVRGGVKIMTATLIRKSASERLSEELDIQKDSPGSPSVHVPTAGEEQKMKKDFDEEIESESDDFDVYKASFDDMDHPSAQRIVEGIDWETIENDLDETSATEAARANLSKNPDYYRERFAQRDGNDNTLAKDEDGLRLDLGSGQCREPGFIGFDLYPHDAGTLVHDVTLGIPAADASAQAIRLVNSLAYMDGVDKAALLNDVARTLKEGGQFIYEGPDSLDEYPSQLELIEEANNADNLDESSTGPWFRKVFKRVIPDEATAQDSFPRLSDEEYGELDTIVAGNALGYYWSDATASAQSNRAYGYPSQGSAASLKEPPKEVTPDDVGKDHDAENIDTLEESILTFLEEEKTEKTLEGATLVKDGDVLLDAPEDGEDAGKDGDGNSFPDKGGSNALGYLGKSKSVGIQFPIVKADTEKQVVYGVVLTPDEVDSQDDYMTAEDIEKAAHHFLVQSRVVGKQHEAAMNKAEVVESYIAPQDMEWNGQYGPQTVKQGAWVLGVKINDKREWQRVVDGEYQGFSVGGYGVRD